MHTRGGAKKMKVFSDMVAKYAQTVEHYEPWTAVAGALLGCNAGAYYFTQHDDFGLFGLMMTMASGAAGTFAGYFLPSVAPFLVLAAPGAALGYAKRHSSSKTEILCAKDNTKWQKEVLMK